MSERWVTPDDLHLLNLSYSLCKETEFLHSTFFSAESGCNLKQIIDANELWISSSEYVPVDYCLSNPLPLSLSFMWLLPVRECSYEMKERTP